MTKAERKANAITGFKLVMTLMVGYILLPYILTIGGKLIHLMFTLVMMVAFIWLGMLLVTSLGSVIRNAKPTERIKFNAERQAEGRRVWNKTMTWLSNTFKAWQTKET